MQKENGQTREATLARIAEMELQLNSKNSYFNNFRKPEVVAAAAQQEAHAQTNPRGYDNVYEMEDETADRGEYCQKSKYESRWCKNRKPREDIKQN